LTSVPATYVLPPALATEGHEATGADGLGSGTARRNDDHAPYWQLSDEKDGEGKLTIDAPRAAPMIALMGIEVGIMD